MIYVMSDIHGCLEEFQEMLELIHFSQEDKLYILGDVIDRGPYPIETLKLIQNTSNISMIMGNHEYMMLNYFKEREYDSTSKECQYAKQLWLQNGGKITLEQFSKLNKKEATNLLNYVKNLKYYQIVEINNIVNLMVHAGIYPYNEPDLITNLKLQTIDDLLWIRNDFLYRNNIKYPFRIIFGHTPIASFSKKLHYWDSLEKKMKYNSIIEKEIQDKILYFNNRIAIDGGCVFGYYLTCLCLNNGNEFFVLNKNTENILSEN